MDLKHSKLLEPVKDEPGLYRLRFDVRVNVGPFQWVDLHSGTRTNFANIPKRLHWLIDPDANDIALAALVHDSLVGEFGPPIPIKSQNYTSARLVPLERFPTWKKAARVFRSVMYDTKAPGWKRFLCYNAVRGYGIFREFKNPTNGS